MSFKEQVLAFYNSSHIIAPSGAALTNLLFINSNCKVLIFQQGAKDIPIFSNLVGFNNIDIRYVVEKQSSIYDTHSHYHINIDVVKEYLYTVYEK